MATKTDSKDKDKDIKPEAGAASQPEPTAEEQVPFVPKTTYIVGGVEVDANGNPVGDAPSA